MLTLDPTLTYVLFACAPDSVSDAQLSFSVVKR